VKNILSFIKRMLGIGTQVHPAESASPPAATLEVNNESEAASKPPANADNELKTEIIAILDRSGSMEAIESDAIGGYNAFLKRQQQEPGPGRMTLVLFGDDISVLYAGKPLAEAEPLTRKTFVPAGSTALLDAIGTTLDEQGARIAAEGWADQVIVCILTDGAENSSRRYTNAEINSKVKGAQERGWLFVFLAANQDAFAAADQYGIDRGHTRTFAATSQGTQDAYDSLSSKTVTFRTQARNAINKARQSARDADPTPPPEEQ